MPTPAHQIAHLSRAHLDAATESYNSTGAISHFDALRLHEDTQVWGLPPEHRAAARRLLDRADVVLHVVPSATEPLPATGTSAHRVRLHRDGRVALLDHSEFEPTHLEDVLLLLSLNPVSLCPCFRFLPQYVAKWGVPKNSLGQAYIISVHLECSSGTR